MTELAMADLSIQKDRHTQVYEHQGNNFSFYILFVCAPERAMQQGSAY